MAFRPLGNSDHVVVAVSIDFPTNSQWGCPSSSDSLTIFVLIGAVFMIIWEMFHGRMSLDSVLLLLLVSFLSGFRLELMHICPIHLHGFQLLMQLPQFIEITFFVCTNKLNLQNLKQSSCRLVIVAKGFLKLPNLHMIIKQKSPSFPRNVALWTFGKLTIVFLTKLNLLYLYSTPRNVVFCIW